MGLVGEGEAYEMGEDMQTQTATKNSTQTAKTPILLTTSALPPIVFSFNRNPEGLAQVSIENSKHH